MTRSLDRTVISSAGHWIATVDGGGYAVCTSVNVVGHRPAGQLLPAADATAPMLTDIGRNFAHSAH